MRRAPITGSSPLRCLLWAVGLLGCTALVAAGCQQAPKVAEMGESVETGKMSIEVTDYELRQLELIDGDRTHDYERPVLAVSVALTNRGDEPFRYIPTHDSEQVTEQTAPLLYHDPGKDEPLPPGDKTSIRINGVTLEEGELDAQVRETTQIAAGETLEDVVLFEVPDGDQADLILSLPPATHRGRKPVLFRIPYQRKAPEGPTWHELGEAASFDGVDFTVSEVATEYVELEPPGDAEEAFSQEPIFKVVYEISNGSDEAITYNPGHRTVSGRRGAALFGDGEQFARVRFSSNTSVVDQQSDKTEIAAGESLTDFSLFERPGEEVSELKFEYPASRFGRAGLVRFTVPYDYETPDKPEPLQDDDEDDEE